MIENIYIIKLHALQALIEAGKEVFSDIISRQKLPGKQGFYKILKKYLQYTPRGYIISAEEGKKEYERNSCGGNEYGRDEDERKRIEG